MQQKVIAFAGLRILLVTFILVGIFGGNVFSQERSPMAKEASVSLEDLEALVKTLETPEKREAFISQLKSLIEIRKELSAPKPRMKKPSLVDRALIGYTMLGEKLGDYVNHLLRSIRQLPSSFKSGLDYVRSRENRAILYKSFGTIAAGIALALLVIFLIRWLSSVLLGHVSEKRDRAGFRRVYDALVKTAIGISPYLGLLTAAFLAFKVLGIRGLVYDLAMLFLLTLLQYALLSTGSRAVLNVEDAQARFVPVSDETAAYASVWARRFLIVWILYYFVTDSLAILRVPTPVYVWVRGILIFFFPLLSTMLLLQVKKMERLREKAPAHLPVWKKYLRFGARYWPLGLGVLIWLVAIFAMARYEKGIGFIIFACLKTLVTVGVLWGLFHLVERLFRFLFGLGKAVKARFPDLERKTNRYIGSFRGIIKGVILAVGIGYILESWGLRASWFVTSEVGSDILSRLIKVAITVGIIVLILDIGDSLRKQLLQPKTSADGTVVERGRKTKTLIPLGHWLIMVASIFVGGVVILSQMGVNVTPILAGAGIVGLAIGFGAQSLVKDFINGLFLLFEGSVAVGDVVAVNGTGGLVEAVTLRTIKMRDLAGNVHVIPNGSVDMITNMTKDYSRYVFEVGVAYREDVDEVMAILKEIGESLQNDPEYAGDILEPLEILGVDKFDDSAVIIKARFTTKPIKQWRVGREFNRRMKKMFDERGIEIPFPHRTVYWGEPKTGSPPPLAIQVAGGPLSGNRHS